MILVSGAAGFNGREIVRQLMAAGEPVRALVPDEAAGVPARALGAEVAVVDAAEASGLAPAFAGVDRAVLVPPNAPDQVARERAFIDAARTAGIRHLVKFSAAGAAVDSPAAILRWHGESERLLLDSGVPYTIVRPVWFMQNLLGIAAAIKGQGAIALPMGAGKVSTIDMADIAAVIVAALTRPGHVGKAYLVTGPEAFGFTEIAAHVERIARHPVRYDAITGEAFRTALVGWGQPEWMADALVELFAAIERGEQAEVTTAVADVAGRPPTTLDAFLRKQEAAFA